MTYTMISLDFDGKVLRFYDCVLIEEFNKGLEILSNFASYLDYLKGTWTRKSSIILVSEIHLDN